MQMTLLGALPASGASSRAVPCPRWGLGSSLVPCWGRGQPSFLSHLQGAEPRTKVLYVHLTLQGRDTARSPGAEPARLSPHGAVRSLPAPAHPEHRPGVQVRQGCWGWASGQRLWLPGPGATCGQGGQALGPWLSDRAHSPPPRRARPAPGNLGNARPGVARAEVSGVAPGPQAGTTVPRPAATLPASPAPRPARPRTRCAQGVCLLRAPGRGTRAHCVPGCPRP